MNSRRLTEWQIVLWSVFLLCFAGMGVLPLRNVTHLRRFRTSVRGSICAWVTLIRHSSVAGKILEAIAVDRFAGNPDDGHFPRVHGAGRRGPL